MRAAITVLVVLTWLGCVPRRADEATPPPMATLTGIHLELFQGQDLAAFGRAAEVTYERMTGDLTASYTGDQAAVGRAVDTILAAGKEFGLPVAMNGTANLKQRIAQGARIFMGGVTPEIRKEAGR